VNQQKLFRRLRTKQKKISAERGEKQKNFETQKKKKSMRIVFCISMRISLRKVFRYILFLSKSQNLFSLFMPFFSFFLSVVCFLFLSWIDRFGSLTES